MGSSLHLSMFLHSLFFLILSFHATDTAKSSSSSSSSMHLFCHDRESFALIQFKQSFIVNNSASAYHSKLGSWKHDEEHNHTADCCSWDGVECDENSGHVIGLDLSSSSLYGSINSNSSLFHLVHLQRLNLAYNHFNYSQIPSKLGHLSHLTYLNLSNSMFSGKIPAEISGLSKLTLLDLSANEMLELKKPNLGSLVKNLSSLEVLHLNEVNILSAVPHVLANLSSLRSIWLEDCGLHGEFPSSIFKLPNLQHLNVMYNEDLTGNLPDFQWSSPLETLWLVETSFSGELPASIGNLASMVDFDIWSCKFWGSVPISLVNLTRLVKLGLGDNSFGGQFPSFLANLTQLQFLTAGLNKFHGSDLLWASNLTKLCLLHLTDSNLYGEIPSSFANLTKLSSLYLGYNQITGEIPLELFNHTQFSYLGLSFNSLRGIIPSEISNWSQLAYLDLSFNKLHGPIPNEIFELENLTDLDLSFNNLSGKVELDKFLNLKNLAILHLSGNSLSLHARENRDQHKLVGFPKFKQLGLSSCNFSRFPNFIRNQDRLEWLELAHNNIHGSIPIWMWNTSAETLLILNLSSNFLTSFDQLPDVSPWSCLVILDLSYNMLHGSLPNPPPTTVFYSTSNNSFTGKISPLICKMSSLQVLDLSKNKLNGTIPHCLSKSSHSLSILNLQGNNLEGSLPQRWTKRSRLKMINLSVNKLQGSLPRSLAYCGMLESIDISDNQINDTFPSWLGSLPELKVLLLRSNLFHGEIRNLESNFTFCKLRIIDLSYNDFTGKLPYEFFLTWNPLKVVNVDHLSYLQIHLSYMLPSSYVTGFIWDVNYVFSLTMVNKGLMMEYEKIQELFTAIDFSSNSFIGEIPESIGHMKELYLLNLSNNFLTGCIPTIFGNLTQLESLDLSQNKLSGPIPQQLAQLTFLEIFNVSHNHLEGPIPQGEQFDTFQSSTFDGNSGLCGNPLLRKCENLKGLPPLTLIGEEDQDSDSLFGFDWKIVLIGYACGLIIGAVMGNTIFKRKFEWFLRTLSWRKYKFS